MHSPSLILKIVLIALFIGILSYNFNVANSLKYEADGDAASFIGLGFSLAELQKYGHVSYEHGSLMEAFKSNEFPKLELSFDGYSTWRPPVWPFIIAGIFLVFGINLLYILIFKYLFHLIGIYIFYKTLKLLKLHELIVIVGSFLYGISPAWQLYSRVFLSESITLFFMTLWLYLLIRYVKGKSGFFLQAIAGGILILSHPYYIFLPFSIWLFLWIRNQINIKTFFISTLICASVVSVWIMRNFVVLKTNEIILTTSSGAVMAKGWNPKVPDEHTNTKGDLADETLVLEGFEDKKRYGAHEVQAMQRYKDATQHFIRSNPDLILPIIGKKLASAFNPFPETPRPGILETGRWFFQFLALLSLFYILIFSGNKLFKSLVLGLILSTIAITILTYSGFRFRMPQIGLELLFIMYAVQDIAQRRRKISVDSH